MLSLWLGRGSRETLRQRDREAAPAEDSKTARSARGSTDRLEVFVDRALYQRGQLAAELVTGGVPPLRAE